MVNVQGIHIRYQDASSCPSHPFACGLTLESFSVQTTDSSYQPIPFHTDLDKLYKRLALTRVAVYWQSDCTQALTSNELPSDEDNVLHPVTVTAQVQVVRLAAAAASATPRTTIDAAVDRVAFSISPSLARDAQKLLDAVSLGRARAPHLARRPAEQGYRGAYAAWWAYAINETLIDVRARLRARTFPGLVAQVRLANEYAALFRRCLGVLPLPPLTATEAARLVAIEECSSDEFISAIRNMVQHAVVRDAQDALEAARARARTQPRTGLLGGFGLFGEGDSATEVLVAGIPVRLTVTQQRELEAVIKAATEDDESEDLPALCVTRSLGVELGSAALHLEMPSNAQGVLACERTISSLTVSGGRAVALVRGSNFVLHASLCDVVLQDTTVGPDGAGSKVFWVESESAELDNGCSPRQFLNFRFEKAPVDLAADYALRLTLLRTVFSYSHSWVGNVMLWNQTMAEIASADSIGLNRAIAAVAERVKTVRKTSEELLARAMLSHKVVDVHITADAPIIRFPSRSSSNFSTNVDSVVLIKLGAVSIQSKGTVDGYDLFTISAVGAQVLAGPDGSELEDVQLSEQFRMLGPLTVQSNLQLSIVRDSPALALCKVRCNLPLFKIKIFDVHLKHIAIVLDGIQDSLASLKHSLGDGEESSTQKRSRPERKISKSNSNQVHLGAAMKSQDLGKQKAQFFNALRPVASTFQNSKIETPEKLVQLQNQSFADFEFRLFSFQVEMGYDRENCLAQLEAQDFVFSCLLGSQSIFFNSDLSELHVYSLTRSPALVNKPSSLLSMRGEKDCQNEHEIHAFKMNIRILDRHSPDFMGIDLQTAVLLHTIDISLTPSTFCGFADWVERNDSRFRVKSLANNVPANNDSEPAVGRAVPAHPSAVENSMCMSISLALDKMQFQLDHISNGYIVEVARGEAKSGLLTYVKTKIKTSTVLEVGSCYIIDSAAECDGLFLREVLAPHNMNELLKIEYILYSDDSKVLQPKLIGLVKGFRINMDPNFVDRITDYLSLFQFSKADKSVEAFRKPSSSDVHSSIRSEIFPTCLFDVELFSDECELYLPASSTSEDGVIIRLQNFSVQASKDRGLDNIPAQHISSNFQIRTLLVRNGINVECVHLIGNITSVGSFKELEDLCINGGQFRCHIKTDLNVLNVKIALDDIDILHGILKRFSEIKILKNSENTVLQPTNPENANICSENDFEYVAVELNCELEDRGPAAQNCLFFEVEFSIHDLEAILSVDCTIKNESSESQYKNFPNSEMQFENLKLTLHRLCLNFSQFSDNSMSLGLQVENIGLEYLSDASKTRLPCILVIIHLNMVHEYLQLDLCSYICLTICRLADQNADFMCCNRKNTESLWKFLMNSTKTGLVP